MSEDAIRRLPPLLLAKYSQLPPQPQRSLLQACTVPGDALPCITCALNRSVSQFHEDLLLLPLLLRAAAGRKRAGSFVELGALDGLRWSNTLLLEHCYAWSGLLIEANPKSFAELRRSGRQRSTYRHSAVCAEGVGSVQMSADGDSVAGQVGMMPAAHVQKWTQRGFLTNRTVAVPCAPLGALMRGAGLARGATFLSLDVEGAEQEVLRSVDPAAFAVVVVEMKGGDDWQMRHNRAIEARLQGAGLQPLTTPRIRDSRVFVRPALALPLASASGGRA